MTIENSGSIDGMVISKTDGKVVLQISDHLDWVNVERHCDLLEKKIGAYLGFVQSGQLQERLPKAVGRSVRISVIYQHEPSEFGFKFLNAAKQQLQESGFELNYGALPSNY